MTNPNSASSSNPPSADLSRDILDKVNAHADRSIDKLFADIDELLKTDTADAAIDTDRPFYSNSSSFTPPNSETPFTPPTYSPPLTPPNTDTPFIPPTYSPPFTPPNTERSFTPPNYPSASETNSANSETPFTPPKYFQISTPETYSNQPQQLSAPEEELESNPQPSGFPLWAKVFLSIGVISILSSSILLWLIQKGKISFPGNVNTSWLPGETQPQISPEDAKFADYMRKSISKIESANTQSAPTSNPPAMSSVPAPEIEPTNPTTPIAPPTTATGTATPPPSTEIAPLKTTVSLTKTMQTGDRIGATFQIGNRAQTVNVGEKIGKTGWSLSTVTENSIIVVKPGRENKSIAIGQKF